MTTAFGTTDTLNRFVLTSIEAANQLIEMSQANDNAINKASTEHRIDDEKYGDFASTSDDDASDSGKKRRRWVKPLDMPKRPLSAYNIFFRYERSLLVDGANPLTMQNIIPPAENRLNGKRKRPKRVHRKTHGKIGFIDLTRQIANKWKTLDPTSKSFFEDLANNEKNRYIKELKVYLEKKESTKRVDSEVNQLSSTPSFNLNDQANKILANFVVTPTASYATAVLSFSSQSNSVATITPATANETWGPVEHSDISNRYGFFHPFLLQQACQLNTSSESPQKVVGKLSDFTPSTTASEPTIGIVVGSEDVSQQKAYDPIPCAEKGPFVLSEGKLQLDHDVADFLHILFPKSST